MLSTRRPFVCEAPFLSALLQLPKSGHLLLMVSCGLLIQGCHLLLLLSRKVGVIYLFILDWSLFSAFFLRERTDVNLLLVIMMIRTYAFWCRNPYVGITFVLLLIVSIYIIAWLMRAKIGVYMQGVVVPDTILLIRYVKSVECTLIYLNLYPFDD